MSELKHIRSQKARKITIKHNRNHVKTLAQFNPNDISFNRIVPLLICFTKIHPTFFQNISEISSSHIHSHNTVNFNITSEPKFKFVTPIIAQA